MNASAITSALRTPDLRNKILFTLGLLAIYRVGSAIPTPGVDYAAVQRCISVVQDNSLYAMINLFSGGALLQLSIFALGIMPYITASIILQLLTVVIPRLETLKKDGRAGQATITQYTRYVTIGLAVLQSTAILTVARTPGALFSGCNEDILPDAGVATLLVMVTVMTAGTATVMWLGELITERGIGNGMSLIIFASVISSIPAQFASILGGSGAFSLVLTVAVGIGLVAAVVFIEQGQRRIPIQYSTRMVGRRQYGGTSTYLPLKVNMAGVIPVIFASSLLFLPTLLVQLTGSTADWATWVQSNLATGTGSWYLAGYVALIIFFCYFYVSITFNPVEVADNLKQFGGFIPGIRAGRPTAEYLAYVLKRLTAPGAAYLALVAVLPLLAFAGIGVSGDFIFGGTSLLIAVGVGLDTIKQVQAQLSQRNYEGFLA